LIRSRNSFERRCGKRFCVGELPRCFCAISFDQCQLTTGPRQLKAGHRLAVDRATWCASFVERVDLIEL
jgi:hypothetical protein